MTRVLEIAAKVCFVAFISFFLYGVTRYPDAPIRPCGVDRYCGKQGQPRTVEEYAGFRQWEGALPWVFVLCFLSGLYLNKQSIVRAVTGK